MTRRFDFEVRRCNDKWSVVVSGVGYDGEVTHGQKLGELVDHGVAVEQLRRFIVEAQEALLALERKEEFPPPSLTPPVAPLESASERAFRVAREARMMAGEVSQEDDHE